MSQIHVTLTEEDYNSAVKMGHLRVSESNKQKLSGRAGCKPNMVDQDINGAAAEIAFARALGVKPDIAVNTYHAPDIAGVQVRSTSRENGKLIVRPVDPDNDIYVLMVGSGRKWTVVGAMAGFAAKHTDYLYPGLNGRDPCYMVPQRELSSDVSWVS